MNPPEDEEPFVKIVLIGDYGVGKTSLARRFVDDRYESGSPLTDVKKRAITIDGLKCKLVIFDTCGQERFLDINSSFYRNVRGVLITFAAGGENAHENAKAFESFEHCGDVWIKQLHKAPHNAAVRLVATKIDLCPHLWAEPAEETSHVPPPPDGSCPVSALPLVILSLIISFLHVRDVCACEKVSVSWRQAAREESIWQRACGILQQDTKTEATWKTTYVRRAADSEFKQLTRSKIETFAKEHDLPCSFVSARTGQNVDAMFFSLARQIMQKNGGNFRSQQPQKKKGLLKKLLGL